MLTMRVQIDGLEQTVAAVRALGPDAVVELRERTETVAEELAAKIQAAGQADSRQSARAARTVAVHRGIAPAVVAGPHPLLFGSEFGMTRKSGWYAWPRFFDSAGRQFRPHRGRGSYWFFKAAERAAPDMARQWQAAADAVTRRFGERAAR